MSQLVDGSDWGGTMLGLGRRFDDAVTAIVQQGVDDGSLAVAAGASAKVIAFGLIGLCNWTHRWFDPKGPNSPEQIGEAFATMVLRGLIASDVRTKTT